MEKTQEIQGFEGTHSRFSRNSRKNIYPFQNFLPTFGADYQRQGGYFFSGMPEFWNGNEKSQAAQGFAAFQIHSGCIPVLILSNQIEMVKKGQKKKRQKASFEKRKRLRIFTISGHRKRHPPHKGEGPGTSLRCDSGRPP